jgi:hypothetical protein
VREFHVFLALAVLSIRRTTARRAFRRQNPYLLALKDFPKAADE